MNLHETSETFLETQRRRLYFFKTIVVDFLTTSPDTDSRIVTVICLQPSDPTLAGICRVYLWPQLYTEFGADFDSVEDGC